MVSEKFRYLVAVMKGDAMRKLYLTVNLPLLLLAFFTANAQVENSQERIFKPFKVDIGVNLTFPVSPELTLGGGFFVEPRYGVNDRIHLGIHLGSNIIGEGKFLFNNKEAVTRAQAIANLSLTGEYHFVLEEVRPFVGISGGMYRRSDYEVVDNTSGVVIIRHGTIVNLGMAPRVGIIAGKFRMNATYHFSGKGITDFVSLGLGIQFGGGRR